MKSVIIHADGRCINLADAIDPGVYAELEGTQGRHDRKNPLLFCGGCGGGIYIRHGTRFRDQLFGAHYERIGCPETLVIRGRTMSDEHKRMQEYAVRSAGHAGLHAETEVRTTGRTIVDVVIDRRIGVEVQRSRLPAGSAVNRTGRSMAAGLETVSWVAETVSAPWLGRVPGFQWLDNGQLQDVLPGPRSVRSRGVMTFQAERAGPRGEWLPVVKPLTALVDDAVVRLAAGTIQPVIYQGNVQLVQADGVALYEEMTGISLDRFAGRAPARTLSRTRRADCTRPPVRDPAAPGDYRLFRRCEGDGCDDDSRPYEGGVWLCPGHARRRYAPISRL